MKATRLETLEAEYKKTQINKDESVKIMEEKEEVQYIFSKVQIVIDNMIIIFIFIHRTLENCKKRSIA